MWRTSFARWIATGASRLPDREMQLFLRGPVLQVWGTGITESGNKPPVQALNPGIVCELVTNREFS